jgi:parallel beta-helix repeat protein
MDASAPKVAPEVPPAPAPEPQGGPAPQAQPEPALPPGKLFQNPRTLLLLAVAVIVVLAVGFAALQLMRSPAPSTTIATVSTTSSVTTTVAQSSVSNINNCTRITKGGTYFLTRNINTSNTAGACITVSASNVKLVGNGNSVTGSGPYSGVAPYSYGIALNGVSNVTITGFRVLKFSYDIYLNRSANSVIIGNNATKSSISGIYLLGSVNNTVQSDYVSASDSAQGGVYLAAGSNGNRVLNNTVQNNVYAGIVVNSTGNSFSKNRLLQNPQDIKCNATSAPRHANNFSSSSCSTNYRCEFAQCTTNVPYNLSAISIGPGGSVSTCGQISYPGRYVLASNLSTSAYLNNSRPADLAQPCLRVAVSNVKLSCGGNSISNSGYGVYLASTVNTSVSNCVMKNDTYGVYFKNQLGPLFISNLSAVGSTYGIYIQNATGGKVSNVILTNNTYGIYLNLTNGVSFSSINAKGNRYGAYAASGGSDVFSSGIMMNNSKADIYCTAATYSANSSDIMQNIACGVTDCSWAAACKTHVLPSLTSYPISACQPITVPGNYSLTQTIIARGTCFNISSSNVAFNCKGHSITGTASGGAFMMNNRSNVTISNCRINQFKFGVNATSSNTIGLTSISMANVTQGVYFGRVSRSNVVNVSMQEYSVSGFNFSRTSGTTVTQDSATSGVGGASGFVFSNDTGDQVSFNNAGPNGGYGFALLNSVRNTFFNNSAFGNSPFDYFCYPSSSAGLYANQGGVNQGLTKNTCRWIVELPAIPQGPQCEGITSSDNIVLGSDMLYTYGGTCFSVSSVSGTFGGSTGNNTVINCNGHTVLATNGGTFVNIVNGTSGVKVMNCYLRNFTTGVSVSGLYATVTNNTFLNTGTGVSLLPGSNFATVQRNNIQNSTYGVATSNTNYINIMTNAFYGVSNAIGVTGGTSATVENNTATNGAYGLVLSNAVSTLVMSNLLLNMSAGGMYCSGFSTSNNVASHDFGGNRCTSNRNCTWVTSSPMCKAS